MPLLISFHEGGGTNNNGFDISGGEKVLLGRGRMSPTPDGRYYDGRALEERLIALQERNRRARIDNLNRRQMARGRLEGCRAPVSRHGSTTTCAEAGRYVVQDRTATRHWRNGSPRHGSMSPLRHRDRRKDCSFSNSAERSGPAGFADRLHRLNNKAEMIEKSGFNTLDIVDGDCVREEEDEYPASLRSTHSHCSPLRRFGYGNIPQGRSNFFENDDDSPLLVSSIDGISTQVSRPTGYVSGPSSLEQDLLLRSDSQFSLLTPSSPFSLVKTRSDLSPSKQGSIANLSLGSPYSSIRKRIKSVSMKYLKMMPRRTNSKLAHDSLEENPGRPDLFSSPNQDILRYEDVLRKDLERLKVQDGSERIGGSDGSERLGGSDGLDETDSRRLLDTEATVHTEYSQG